MLTKKQYVEYLLSTPLNYTCTNLANHLDNVSHDSICDFLKRERFTSRQLWELTKPYVNKQDDTESYLICDDSVQDKRYSRFIELVKKQYSGNEHGTVKGIGLVNMIHSSGKDGDFYPIDYRIYSPDSDGKTKNDHFQEMFLRTIADKSLKARTILFDSWYSSVDNLKLIHRNDWTFFTTLKSNRMVSISKEQGYIHLDTIEWSEKMLQVGIMVKLKEIPFLVKLFKIVSPDGHIDWVITNSPDDNLWADDVKESNAVRWQVEEFHRAYKQLTGSEKCQCRAARSQRNHLACCYHAWLSLKIKAKELNQSLYQVRNGLFADFLKSQLRKPQISAA
ncbi:IS701 family transposase [Emticicia soli]|uniref:Transposase n=1 Tax=Emticicia soli TaxID=2027878 RepID=A0ABW5J2Z0_9BACT